MYSRKYDNISFHFNGGLDSGDVIIIDSETNAEIKVRTSILLELVAHEYVLPKRISELEQSDYKELLK